jgi:hypothetical protein
MVASDTDADADGEPHVNQMTLFPVEPSLTPPLDVPVEYRPIAGFDGYRVGSDGSVWSRCKRGRGGPGRVGSHWRRCAGGRDGDGYWTIGLAIGDGRIRRRRVHRLVLEAFVGPCPPGMLCCHGDNDPGNNRLTNLRWDTPTANMEDYLRSRDASVTKVSHCKTLTGASA